MLELQMGLVSLASLITCSIYMVVGMIQGGREIDENLTRRRFSAMPNVNDRVSKYILELD